MSSDCCGLLLFGTWIRPGFPRLFRSPGILQNDTRVRVFQAGDLILREGDYGHSAFLILRGVGPRDTGILTRVDPGSPRATETAVCVEPCGATVPSDPYPEQRDRGQSPDGRWRDGTADGWRNRKSSYRIFLACCEGGKRFGWWQANSSARSPPSARTALCGDCTRRRAGRLAGNSLAGSAGTDAPCAGMETPRRTVVSRP